MDAYDALQDPRTLQVTLLDQDQQALDLSAQRLAPHCQDGRVALLQEDLVPLSAGRRPLTLDGQDLIYSVGLIDYFPDRFVVALMNLAHRLLRPGGRLILGSFHPRNPTRALMDHVFDWELRHRTQHDMNRLFPGVGVRSPLRRGALPGTADQPVRRLRPGGVSPARGRDLRVSSALIGNGAARPGPVRRRHRRASSTIRASGHP